MSSSEKSADEKQKDKELIKGTDALELEVERRRKSIDSSSKSHTTAFDQRPHSSDVLIQSTPLVSRITAERPKSMLPIPNSNSSPDRHLNSSSSSSSSSPPTAKSTFPYFESLKASYRQQHTKSEEHLQEAAAASPSKGSHSDLMSYVKPSPPSAAAASPCVSKISGNGRRRSVEKSQSFKIFNNNSNSGASVNSPLDSVSDRRDLFNMNRPVSYKEFSKPQIVPRSEHLRNSSVLEQSPPKTIPEVVMPVVKTNNIIQIEENIDKLVSSPFVPLSQVLKKVAAAPGVGQEEKKSNVSITTIRSSINDLSGSSTEKSSSSEESSPIKSPAVALRRRSSSAKMEKSPSVGSLNTLGQSEENKVPEFMRIHLNRVDNNRPKSSIVLYKGTSDTLPRRFSRELDGGATKPPLPPVLNVSTLKRPSINKSQETITESNHVIIVPVGSPRKGSIESVAGSPTKAETYHHPPLPVAAPAAPSPVTAAAVQKPEPVVLRESFSERKGSVSEEKAKIERRLSIADEKSMIRKKSLAAANSGNGSGGNRGGNKEDNTPELMKVFARRSMKIKDEEDDDPPAAQVVQKSDSRSSMITDSDKENQSSSREELSPQKSKIDEDQVTKEQKLRNGDAASYRTRTFLEVKNMLQTTNGNAVNKSSGLRAAQKCTGGGGSGGGSGDMVRKESPRNSVSESHSQQPVSSSISETADKLPEFKRIVERREEWESRAKMWK